MSHQTAVVAMFSGPSKNETELSMTAGQYRYRIVKQSIV